MPGSFTFVDIEQQTQLAAQANGSVARLQIILVALHPSKLHSGVSKLTVRLINAFGHHAYSKQQGQHDEPSPDVTQARFARPVMK